MSDAVWGVALLAWGVYMYALGRVHGRTIQILETTTKHLRDALEKSDD